MRRALAVASLLCALAPTVSAGAATSVVEVGWWTSSPFAEAPDGGVVVGKAPNGPASVSAIRLELGRGVTSARLELEESGGFAQEVAAIAVCRGDEAWTAVAGGDLEDAPEASCAGSPPLLDEDGDAWTLDLKPLLGDATGRVTVMLIPGESTDPTGTLGLGWEVQFDKPVLAATEVAAPPTTTTTTAPSTTPTTAAPTATPSLAPSGGVSRATTTTTEPVTTTTASAVEAESGQTGAPRPLGAPGGPDEPRPWGRFGLFILLSAVAGSAAGGARWLLSTRLRRLLP